MEWADEGIVIATRPHGETSAVCELFTKHHGRHLGLVRGGRSKRMRPICQIGNVVSAAWRARLDEHLGHFTLELEDPAASRFFDEPMTLAGLGTLCAHLNLFAERDPHQGLYQGAKLILSHLPEKDIWPGLLVRFELEVLTELGVGLDLSRCAATGTSSDLIYVSPKSGRAVSSQAGEPYKDKLLALPAFLLEESQAVSFDDLLNGFALTGYFFEKHFWSSNPDKLGGTMQPQARQQFIKLFQRLSGNE